MTSQQESNGFSLDQLAGSALIRARPWDVIGAALGAPMIVWGLLSWFSTIGDTGSGIPGFYSGTGAAGIALVIAASALTLNLVLSGRAHESVAPPIAVFLAGGAAVIVLGGMIAKPQSITISSGAVAGLLTAMSQTASLTVGWVKGSGKAVSAGRLAAFTAAQEAADKAARAQPAPGYGSAVGYRYPPATYPAPSYPASSYPPPTYPQQTYPQQTYPQQTYPQQTYPQDTYPQQTYPQQTYPQQTYPPPPGPERG